MGPGNRRTDNSSKRRITIALALSAFFLLTAGTSTASAARGLLTGFADFSYQSADPAIRSSLFDRTLESGAGLVRLNVPWSGVARVSPPDPANPGSVAYDFSVVDPAVRDARARGLTVMLNVSGAPSWAEGSDRPASATPGTWKPSPTSLAAFMRAVTARYSGGFDPDGPGVTPPLPAIQAIQVWNEPNLPDHLAPQYQGPTPFMPDYYRRMLNDSYSAVKAVNPSMLVVTGGTGPYGGPSLQGPRSRPVAFDRLLLCVRQVRKTGKSKKGKKGKKRKNRARFIRAAGCDAPTNFDVLAHHPINTSGPPTQHAFNKDDASSAELGRIALVLRGAEHAGTVSGGRHPIWATEMWWDSNPPNSAGSPLARQARWIEQALYLAWHGGASAVINLLVRDARADSSGQLDGSGSGIYLSNGQAKPSATAYRFPFVATRHNRKTLGVWGRTPAAGRLAIQRRARHRWVTVRTLRVRSGTVFALRLGLRGRQLLRAHVAGVQSLVWKQK